MPKPVVITARIHIEAGRELPEKARAYVVNQLKRSLSFMREGSVLITLYDEDGHLIGADLSGSPTEELQNNMERLTGQRGDDL